MSHPELTWSFVQRSWKELSAVETSRQMGALAVFVTSHLRAEADVLAARIFLSARWVDVAAVEKMVAQTKIASEWTKSYGGLVWG